MRRISVFQWIVPSLLLCVVLAQARVDAVPIPEGFFQIASSEGTTTWRKDYVGGQPDFVVVIDLERARVDAVTGAVVRTGEGPFGGPNPAFERLSLRALWDRERGADSRVRAVVNAQFFDPSLAREARLAFASWSGGANQSDGYGTHVEFPGQMLLLEVDHAAGAAAIVPFDAARYTRADGPDLRLAGLTVDANKGPLNRVGRTFVGIRDDTGDGRADTVMIFCSSFAQQPEAAGVLSAFGAQAQIMLDGGGSSQLIVDGTSLVSSSRTIPHALVARDRPGPRCLDACAAGATACDGERPVVCAPEPALGGCLAWRTDDTGAGDGPGRCDPTPPDDPPTPDDCDGASAGCDAPDQRVCGADARVLVCVRRPSGCVGVEAAEVCEGACRAGTCVAEEATTCPEAADCSRTLCGPDPVCGELCGTCRQGRLCEDGQCVDSLPVADAGGEDVGADGALLPPEELPIDGADAASSDVDRSADGSAREDCEGTMCDERGGPRSVRINAGCAAGSRGATGPWAWLPGWLVLAAIAGGRRGASLRPALVSEGSPPCGTLLRCDTLQTWDGAPVAASEAALWRMEVVPAGLLLTVDAPFRGDPAPPLPPGRCPRLWEYEVVECMLLGDDDEYLEIELGPHGHWLALQLRGERALLRDTIELAPTFDREDARWSARVVIPSGLLPSSWSRMNTYAIHGEGPGRRYLAWRATGGTCPDFHRLERFGSWNEARSPSTPTEL